MAMPVSLMGVLNVTPDSCHDYWETEELAVNRGIQMYQQGANLIDIGGESTRPGARPVPLEEELQRVLPVILKLKNEIPIPLSIDTMKHKVAEEALKAGVTFINDVTGFRCPIMRGLAADSKADICVMHMQGLPSNMQDHPHYPEGITNHLLDWFARQIDLLIGAGVQEDKIYLDPGIGFGKTVAHNVEVLHNLHRIKAMGFPVLIGLSRKSFLGRIINKHSYSELLPVTLAAATLALQAGVDILRVHDVAEHRQVIDLMEHLKGL